jgi:chemosensory pili system protein ChpA (sensor histidine kinase/response regulator)
MADVTQAVDDAAQAAAGTDEAAQDGQGPTGGAETMSMDEARKLRRESQNLRKRLAELEKVDADRKAAELSEAEQAKQAAQASQQELAKLREEHRTATVRYEVMLLASKLNVVDPDAAVRLLDLEAIETAEDGALDRAAVEAALKALLKAKPYLVKPEQVTAPETNARNGRQKEDAAAREEELKRRYRIGV